jgi:hypothetical protein
MLNAHFFLAVFAIFIAITLIQWFFVGFLFHKYQALTPATWRRETYRSYMYSMLLSLFFAFMFVTLFYLWKGKNAELNVLDGIKFGILCWLTFCIGREIESGIYVNLSKMFITGKSLSSLVEFTVAGILAVTLL